MLWHEDDNISKQLSNGLLGVRADVTVGTPNNFKMKQGANLGQASLKSKDSQNKKKRNELVANLCATHAVMHIIA